MPGRCTTILVLGAALASLAPRARAQEPASAPPGTPAVSARPASTGGMIGGAVVGSVLGMFLGIPLGGMADNARGYDSSCRTCTRWGAAGGAGAGATLGVVVGVHAVNGGRGRFLPVLARTSATMAVGWGVSYLAYRAGGEGWDVLGILAAVAAATGVAIHAERATMPRPLPAPPPKVAPAAAT